MWLIPKKSFHVHIKACCCLHFSSFHPKQHSLLHGACKPHSKHSSPSHPVAFSTAKQWGWQRASHWKSNTVINVLCMLMHLQIATCFSWISAVILVVSLCLQEEGTKALFVQIRNDCCTFFFWPLQEADKSHANFYMRLDKISQRHHHSVFLIQRNIHSSLSICLLSHSCCLLLLHTIL